MPRILQIERKKYFAGCLIPYQIILDGKRIGTVKNGRIFRCFISDHEPHTVKIIGNTSIGIVEGETHSILANDQPVAFLLTTAYRFSHGSSYRLESTHYFPPQYIPLCDVLEINNAGIRYTNAEGQPSLIRYSDAYDAWRHHYNQKRSRIKYICNRTKLENGWKFIFFTNPLLIFFADQAQDALWNNFIKQVRTQGFYLFDAD